MKNTCTDCGVKLNRANKIFFAFFRLPPYCDSCYKKHGEDSKEDFKK